jgi:hypothetical protein
MKSRHFQALCDLGLYQYLEKDLPLPPKKFIEDLQYVLKKIYLDPDTEPLNDQSYTYNWDIPVSIREKKSISKKSKSSIILVFDETPGPDKGDIITIGKRGKRYMDKVKKDGNMGTGGGRLKNPKDSKNGKL